MKGKFYWPKTGIHVQRGSKQGINVLMCAGPPSLLLEVNNRKCCSQSCQTSGPILQEITFSWLLWSSGRAMSGQRFRDESSSRTKKCKNDFFARVFVLCHRDFSRALKATRIRLVGCVLNRRRQQDNANLLKAQIWAALSCYFLDFVFSLFHPKKKSKHLGLRQQELSLCLPCN